MMIGYGEKGCPVGESHPNAKLTDAEVDRMRDLHEAGESLTHLAEMFEVRKSTVHYIVTYQRRAQVVTHWREERKRG